MSSSSNPLISIVIPHFNRVELLQETLDSIKAQEYENWEVLVVDDGSTDEQWLALQSLATEQILVSRRTDGDKGPSRCRNLGVAESKGQFLIFVDSDDILAPWCLSERINKVMTTPEADLWVFQVMLFKDRPGDMDVSWNRLEGDDDLQRFLCSDPPWHTSSPVWSKDAFLALGGFNEKVMYGDDAELHTRALLAGIAKKKFTECLSDVFIRRSDQRRITNVWSRALMLSRQIRLTEGSQLLRQQNADVTLVDIWEGQYFVECEELLFNVSDSREGIRTIINAWRTHYQPTAIRRWLVRLYFRVGLQCRDRAYLVLRITRRLMMVVLPADFFPSGGYFQHWQVSDQSAQEIRQKLACN